MVTLEDGYIQITKDCNQNCIFCTQPKENLYMTLDEVKQMVLYYKQKGFKSIVLTGGEPSIHPELANIIRFIKSEGLDQRIITNGVKFADFEFAKEIALAGLPRVAVSIHTHLRDKNIEITENDYLKERLLGIKNLIKAGIAVHINTTLISENCSYLSDFYRFMLKEYPEIPHYVLNFVEVGGRAAENIKVIPMLSKIELELSKSLKMLHENGKSIRVERVPLCYMCDYEEYSSETRRIVGEQQYHSYFIATGSILESGKEGSYSQQYNKFDACSACFMASVCAGLKDHYFELYGTDELYPLFKSPLPLIEKGLSD